MSAPDDELLFDSQSTEDSEVESSQSQSSDGDEETFDDCWGTLTETWTTLGASSGSGGVSGTSSGSRDSSRRARVWKLLKTHPKYFVGRTASHQLALSSDEAFIGLDNGAKAVSKMHLEVQWNGKFGHRSKATIMNLGKRRVAMDGSHGKQKLEKNNNVYLYDGMTLSLRANIKTLEVIELKFTSLSQHQASRTNSLSPLDQVYDVNYSAPLGQGHFADVYEALHRSTPTKYAIKAVKRKPGSDNVGNGNTAEGVEVVQEYEKEFNIMQGLRHPYVCEAKELIWEPNPSAPYSAYLVLELAPNGDLYDLISARGRLPEPLARRLSYQILEATAYLHEHGVTHRDLKPQNILMSGNGDELSVKVTDLGLAKRVSRNTIMKSAVGTPEYAAPELYTHSIPSGGFTNKLDSWSVGLVIYNMLLAESPFPQGSYRRHGPDGAFLTSEEAADKFPGVSPAARDLILKLLENEPLQRLSCTQALKHEWFAPLRNSNKPGGEQQLVRQLSRGLSQLGFGNSDVKENVKMPGSYPGSRPGLVSRRDQNRDKDKVGRKDGGRERDSDEYSSTSTLTLKRPATDDEEESPYNKSSGSASGSGREGEGDVDGPSPLKKQRRRYGATSSLLAMVNVSSGSDDEMEVSPKKRTRGGGADKKGKQEPQTPKRTTRATTAASASAAKQGARRGRRRS